MRVLENLEPKKVFGYFEDICQIPHGSQNLDGISSFLEKFAKDRNLFCIRDEANNIIIVKEATHGYEDVEPVILQGHMDMVAVKKSDCDIDLEKDPLKVCVDGDFVFAEGTSLGGDDGIAVAYILAILDSDDIKHPRIEAVITTDEEIGMEGATAIDLSMLKANQMINIDSDIEGILLTSCAGGARVDCKLPVAWVSAEGTLAYQICVKGLTGGHSGGEIHKERANAIKLLGRVLYAFDGLRIAELSGGEKDNAIPREASGVVCVCPNEEKNFLLAMEKCIAEITSEFASKEKNLCITVEKVEAVKKALTKDATRRVVNFLKVLPNGVIAKSVDIEGLVETSLNVGILTLDETEMVSSSAVRSSIESAKQNLIDELKILSTMFGGSYAVHGEYPGWQYNPDSQLQKTMARVYREMFGKELKIEAIHAGLECGLMIAKKPGLDCVSFGPNMYDIHTTEEKLSISSTQRMWDYLLAVLSTK